MNKEEILNNIKKIAPRHCDNCGAKYTPEDFKVVQFNTLSALIHLNCRSCNSTYIINAFANESGLGSQRIPLILDLNGPAELEKFTQNGLVEKDDAIDLYNTLQENSTLDALFPIKEQKKINRTEESNTDYLGGVN